MKSCSRMHWLYYVLGAVIVLLILAYFFQWQALYSFAPFLLLLCCPLMMLMMHGSHGDHGQHHSHGQKPKDDSGHAHHTM